MDGCLDIVVYNVERGNAIWVSLPDGKNLMFDIGRRENFSPLYDMWQKGVRYLDGLIITHPHTDHVNDIASLKRFYGVQNIGEFLRASHIPSSEIYARNKDQDLSFEYIQFASCFKDSIGSHGYVTWDIGGVHLDIFRPHGCATSNLNNHSLVSFVSYNGCKVLIPGDCETAGWNELLENRGFLKVVYDTKIFVAPHHGLASAYSAELMSQFSPEVCLVSEGHVTDTDICGYYSKKSSGHHVSIKGRPEEIRCVITTRNDGNIWIRVFGNPYRSSYTISTFE